MAITQTPNGRQQFFNADGPLVGGRVYTFVPGTTVAKTTYVDNTGTSTNTNPITLDAIGSAAIWGNGAYRQQVFDSLGNEVWDAVTGGSGIIFGIVVSDYPTVQLADAAAAAADQALICPPASTPWTLATSYSFQAAPTFIEGAQLSVAAGQTATFIFPVTAPPFAQIFTGPGSVVGIRQVYVDWWGAVRGGSTGTLSAHNSAYACVAASVNSFGGRQRIRWAGGIYGLEGPWVTPVSANVGIHFEGAGVSLNGTRLKKTPAWYGTRLW